VSPATTVEVGQVSRAARLVRRVLLVAAKDDIGGFSAVHSYGVQPGGSHINAWMSDSSAIPIDDCGESSPRHKRR
jgi:hypothetical protein